MLHVVGSPVDPFLGRLSLTYARGAVEALTDEPGVELITLLATADGAWRLHPGPELDAARGAGALSLPAALAAVAEQRPDVALPQMFCRPGMTTVRAAVEAVGVPLVGNPPEVMAATADKPVASALVAAAGVRVPRGVVIGPAEPLPGGGDGGDDPFALALPVVVKPSGGDNSDGVTLVTDLGDLAAAVTAVRRAHTRALVEEYVPLGREVRCGVVDGPDGPWALPVEEYAVSQERPVRTFEDKLASDEDGDVRLMAKAGDRSWRLPADDPVVPAVHEAALAAYRALGARHYGLVDLRVDPQGHPWFLEAGLYCSYSAQSVLCVMGAAAGLTPRAMFDTAAALALADPGPGVLPRP